MKEGMDMAMVVDTDMVKVVDTDMALVLMDVRRSTGASTSKDTGTSNATRRGGIVTG